MKRALLPVTIIAGILFLLLMSNGSFAHDWHPLKSRHRNVVVVDRHYIVQPYVAPYRCVTPYHGWYYDRRHGYAHRPYHPGYDPRDAYGMRGLIHRPSSAFGFSIGHW